MERIAVLIPCYNESQTVTKVVADWRSKLPEATIYVYDNNSTDGTGDLALKAGAVVKKCYQQGKGNVVRKMFQEVEAQCYIIVDGDDTYPAEAGRKMAEEVLEHDADMVIGDRLSSTYFQENKRPFHNFGNALVRKAINWIFACDISDIMTGYRAFSYRFVKAFPVLSQGFEIETEMTIFAVDKNMRIVNEIIDYRDRPQGSVSKLNTYSDGVKVLLTIARLFKDYRPAYFFGLVSLLLVLLATCFFVPVLADFIKSGVVDKIPTLIVCGFTVLAAIISFFSGMILQSEKNQERRDFEFHLQEIQKWSWEK